MNKDLLLGYMLNSVDETVRRIDKDDAEAEDWDGKRRDDQLPDVRDLN